MLADARLNLLLTPPPRRPGDGQPWHQTISRLLVPLGVRTFEATSGQQAVDLIERHPIHLAVVDTRLPAICGLNVLQLIQRLRDQAPPSPPASPYSAEKKSDSPPAPQLPAIHFQMQVEETTSQGHTHRRIEVRFDAQPQRPAAGPVVILIAPPPPQQDPQLLQEALKFNAFSVLSEPVDVNLALDVMARAMKRWFSGQWPSTTSH